MCFKRRRFDCNQVWLFRASGLFSRGGNSSEISFYEPEKRKTFFYENVDRKI